MEIKGKVTEVSPVINVTDTFKKRELVIEYAENPQYPEFIKFEANQDKTALLDGITVGSHVEVFFNLRGRPWTDRNGKTSYFNSLVLWRINKINEGEVPQYAQPIDTNSPEEDDLPF